MSQENVQIVRRANEPHDGEDLVAVIRGALDGLDWSDADAVIATVAQDPTVEPMHPEIEWDASAFGIFGVEHGFYGLAVFWRELVEVWESYVYDMREYRDLGDWVLTVNDARVRGRGGIEGEMQGFQLWKVLDGKIVTVRLFQTESEALKALGLEG